jgi:hypothetical protein
MRCSFKTRAFLLGIVLAGGVSAQANACGEASCVASQGTYISHFTGTGCTGTESYYLPYNNFAYSCRTWNGSGECGTIQRTVTNRSYKYNGKCSDAWPSGNTLSQFVTVYRQPVSSPPVPCGGPYTYGGSAPLSVAFDAYCSYDPDGGYITNYQWDLWDGVDWGVFIYHTYYYPGNYPVWLKVWDDEGQSNSRYVGTISVY